MYHIYRTLHFQAFADILKTDMNKDVIKNNIRKLREEKGWTQAELGAKLFVSDKLISKWERGESLPDSDNLVRLASLAGQSAGEFIGGDRIYSDDDCVAKTPPEKRRLKYNVVSFIADIGIVALITAMFVFAAIAYEELPNSIGIHFNIEGEADGFGNKGFLFLLPGLGAFFGLLALVLNLVKARWSINLLVPVFFGERKHYDTFFERYVLSSYLRNGKTAAPCNRRIFWLVGCHIGHGNRCSISRCIRCV